MIRRGSSSSNSDSSSSKRIHITVQKKPLLTNNEKIETEREKAQFLILRGRRKVFTTLIQYLVTEQLKM